MVLEVLGVDFGELMVVDVGFLNVGAVMVSAVLYLGNPRQRPMIQLSQVFSWFSIIILSCYLTLYLYSPMFLHALLFILMPHMNVCHDDSCFYPSRRFFSVRLDIPIMCGDLCRGMRPG